MTPMRPSSPTTNTLSNPSPSNPGGRHPPALDEIRTHWPATVDVPTVGRIIGLARRHAYELIKHGEFPAKSCGSVTDIASSPNPPSIPHPTNRHQNRGTELCGMVALMSRSTPVLRSRVPRFVLSADITRA